MPADAGGLVHIALFYRGDRDYLDAVVPFVRAGLANGEPVMVAVPPDKLALLRDALGDTTAGVSMVDMADVGRNPARTFPMISALGGDPKQRVRIVAEPIWPGRSAEAYPSCVQNEALFNSAFADRPLLTLCPYDAAGLDEHVLADARATHPKLQQGGHVLDSKGFSIGDALARCNIPLPVDPHAVTLTVRAFDELGDARAFVTSYAESHGLGREGIRDLQLIATELATNSLEHAGCAATLALWVQDGTIVCQADDAGRLIDPLAGRCVPADHSTGGRGLLLVNALADLVRTHTSAGGTAIRAYLSLDRPAPVGVSE